MDHPILSLSERGQLTIPYKIRKNIPVKHFVCRIEKQKIILEPLQTREEFFTELDARAKHWEEHGGLTLGQMKKKYHL